MQERVAVHDADDDRLQPVVVRRRVAHDTPHGRHVVVVEPSAQGLGVGRKLVSECVGAARDLGYEKMVLLTSRGLDAARRLYQAHGFLLTREEEQQVWGVTHTAQWWELDL